MTYAVFTTNDGEQKTLEVEKQTERTVTGRVLEFGKRSPTSGITPYIRGKLIELKIRRVKVMYPGYAIPIN